MEIKIGLQSAPRELYIDLETTPEELASQLNDASGLVPLVDARGRTLLVDSDKVAYVEFGAPTQGTVGFRS